MNKIIIFICIVVGVLAGSHFVSAGGGGNHPYDLCPNLIKEVAGSSGLSYEVPAQYDGWTLFLKISNQHVAVPAATGTITPDTLSGWPTSHRGKHKDISHVDACPPPTTTTTTSTTTSTTSTTSTTTEVPPSTTAPTSTSSPVDTTSTTSTTAPPIHTTSTLPSTSSTDPAPTTTAPVSTSSAPPPTTTEPPVVRIIRPPRPDRCLLFSMDDPGAFSGFIPEGEFVILDSWDNAPGLTGWQLLPCGPVPKAISATSMPAQLPETGSSMMTLWLAIAALVGGSTLTLLARRRSNLATRTETSS